MARGNIIIGKLNDIAGAGHSSLADQDSYITIPGSSNPGHIAENYDVFDFALTNREMMEIRDLDRQARYESW